MSNPYTYYQNLLYPPGQPISMNFPTLTQNEQNPLPAEINDQEELNNIVQYIKNLKDPEKREEVTHF